MKTPIITIVRLCILALASVPALSARIVADFEGEFNNKKPGVGWSYLWNPPGVEIGQRADYESLVKAGGGRMVADVVVPAGRRRGGLSLHLMVKAGRLVSGSRAEDAIDGLSHYAIVAYTIQPGEAGSISILDSRLQRQEQDELSEFRIYINDLLFGAEEVSGVEASSFDVNLGELEVGDTIYFALGGGGKRSGVVHVEFKLQKAE